MEQKGKEAKEITSRQPVKVGISVGDVNGIGPEVIIKALNDNRILLDCTPIIYGSSKLFSFHKKQLKGLDFNFFSAKTADDAKKKKVNVVDIWTDELQFELGKATEQGGKYAYESLERSTQDLASGKIDVLVTAPISKEAMAKSGFKFPGHTEYLADLAGQDEALMLMVSPGLRVGLVTSHVALKEVAPALSQEKIQEKLKQFNSSLIRDFGIRKPKIAVFGLNPHAGEKGNMGEEEQQIISPAINRAKEDGILAFGPYPADGFFGSGAMKNFDGILAMYHDQGLAAFKALSFDEGVNFTAGLPIVRTSPDHGTAFDIVGQNKASGQSMRNAIYTAVDVYRNQQFYKEINADSLPISEKEDRRRDNRKSQTEAEKN